MWGERPETLHLAAPGRGSRQRAHAEHKRLFGESGSWTAVPIFPRPPHVEAPSADGREGSDSSKVLPSDPDESSTPGLCRRSRTQGSAHHAPPPSWLSLPEPGFPFRLSEPRLRGRVARAADQNRRCRARLMHAGCRRIDRIQGIALASRWIAPKYMRKRTPCIGALVAEEQHSPGFRVLSRAPRRARFQHVAVPTAADMRRVYTRSLRLGDLQPR